MNQSDYQSLNLVRHFELAVSVDGAESEELRLSAEKVEAELRNSDLSFTRKVVKRATALAQLHGLEPKFQAFVAKQQWLVIGLTVLMFTLGFLGVLRSLSTQTHQVNVYWLLLVLLGINLFSMLLWVAFNLRSSINFSPKAEPRQPQPNYGQNLSPLLGIYNQVSRWFSGRVISAPLFATWAETHLSGVSGRWYLSRTLHLAWLGYLAGGLVALLLTLLGRQYDFVWGSTLLSSSAFVQLTEALGALPAMLGFNVPDAAVVAMSEQGVPSADIAEHRGVWASFLFACILLYGVLPRFLLWALSHLAFRRAQQQQQVDWELPYFYQLRTRLTPQSTSLGVVDADAQGASEGGVREAKFALPQVEELALPQRALVVAYEWGTEQLPHLPATEILAWPGTEQRGTEQSKVPDVQLLNDAQSQARLLDALETQRTNGDRAQQSIVMFVSLQRAADRGAMRFLGNIAKLAELHLLVVRGKASLSDLARWAGWQAIVERINVAPDRLHLVNGREQINTPSADEVPSALGAEQ